MYSAFNQLVFLILCSHCFSLWIVYVLSEEIAHKKNYYHYY